MKFLEKKLFRNNVKHNYKNIYSIILLMITDICAYTAASILAYGTRSFFDLIFDIVEFSFSLHYILYELWWMPVILIFLMASKGLYTAKQPFWQETRKILSSILTSFILIFAIVSIGKMSNNVSRLLIVFMWFYSSILIVVFRYVLKSYVYKLKLFSENAVIIGNSDVIKNVYSSFQQEKYLGLNIVGIVEYEKTNHYNDKYQILGTVSNILQIINKYDVTTAIILLQDENKKIYNVINRLQLYLSRIMFISDRKGLAFSNMETMQIFENDLNYLQVNNNLKSLFNAFIKRLSDIILSIILLPFILIVIIFISIFIKLDSKGPVFYSQKRVGRYGKTIKILKFRSMYKDADIRLKEILEKDEEARKEWEKNYKLKNDPRITPVGNFLRKSSLDELPQIFNVLKGDMSLIGPRPVIKKEILNYYKDMASYYFMVRPGITGLWQISGRSDTSYEDRVSKDSWYVLNWSIWLDFIILIKTPLVVLLRKGAY